jgi:hypothetical protein
MNRKTQTPQCRTFRELLGLAVIGFALWLAAIGWLPVTAANAAQGGHRNNHPEQRLARMQAHLDLTNQQMEWFVSPAFGRNQRQRRLESAGTGRQQKI